MWPAALAPHTVLGKEVRGAAKNANLFGGPATTCGRTAEQYQTTRMAAEMTSPFLTTREAAAFLRLRPSTLERWRSSGSGPPYRKFGGRVVYTLEDLEAFADAGLRTSTSSPDGRSNE